MKQRKFILAAGGIVWLLVVSMGMKVMSDYSFSPSRAATPPAWWPADSQIQRTPDRATLVMSVHPRCPCTRASIRELALLMASCGDKLTAYVAFYKPTGFADDWAKTDLWFSASEIPGVSVLCDDGGIVARHFSAPTSGQVLLYDAQGSLIFSGGITSARGHSGDNAGRSAIVSLLQKGMTDQTATPVFGCPLFDPNSECNEGIQQCNR